MSVGREVCWCLGFRWEERRRERVARVEREVKIAVVWRERWVFKAVTVWVLVVVMGGRGGVVYFGIGGRLFRCRVVSRCRLRGWNLGLNPL